MDQLDSEMCHKVWPEVWGERLKGLKGRKDGDGLTVLRIGVKNGGNGDNGEPFWSMVCECGSYPRFVIG